MHRRLRLTRERLAELTPGDLAGVAAGTATTSEVLPGWYQSIDVMCATVDDCLYFSMRVPCPTYPYCTDVTLHTNLCG